MDAMSWVECWKLVLALWPRWQPNEVQVQLWRDELSGKPRGQVIAAIRKAAAGSYAHHAKLAAVLKSIPSMPNVQKHNPVSRSEVERAKIDNGDILAELQAMDVDTLSAAVVYARKVCGGTLAVKADGPVETWPIGSRGMVWAAAYKLRRGVHYHEDS